MTKEISNNDDIIDSRDVIERIEELETLVEADHDDEDSRLELDSLKELAEQCEDVGDWHWGEALIRDSYFEEYAQQLAEDIGAISREEQWPLNCIDWKLAAEELQQDYILVNFDGIDYWIRG